jgi:DNA-binding HxlR family transcriptional regulator
LIDFKNQTFNCEKELALNIIGGKWKLMIIWELLLEEPLRLNQIEKAIPSAHQRVLINQLKELEKDGLVTRTIHPVMPPKVEYKLTELGQSLKPLVEELYKWGIYLYNYEEK